MRQPIVVAEAPSDSLPATTGPVGRCAIGRSISSLASRYWFAGDGCARRTRSVFAAKCRSPSGPIPFRHSSLSTGRTAPRTRCNSAHRAASHRCAHRRCEPLLDAPVSTSVAIAEQQSAVGEESGVAGGVRKHWMTNLRSDGACSQGSNQQLEREHGGRGLCCRSIGYTRVSTDGQADSGLGRRSGTADMAILITVVGASLMRWTASSAPSVRQQISASNAVPLEPLASLVHAVARVHVVPILRQNGGAGHSVRHVVIDCEDVHRYSPCKDKMRRDSVARWRRPPHRARRVCRATPTRSVVPPSARHHHAPTGTRWECPQGVHLPAGAAGTLCRPSRHHQVGQDQRRLRDR
jgi:hypothetical protein